MSNSRKDLGFKSDGRGRASAQFIDRKIKAIIFKRGRNSKRFVRIIVGEMVSANGVSFEQVVSCFVFGDLVQKAESLRKGHQLRGIASLLRSACGKKYKMHKILAA